MFLIEENKIHLNWMFIVMDPTKINDDYDIYQ